MDTVLQEHIRRTTLVIPCIDIPLIIASRSSTTPVIPPGLAMYTSFIIPSTTVALITTPTICLQYSSYSY